MTKFTPLLLLLTPTLGAAQTVTEYYAVIDNLGATAPGGTPSTEQGMTGFGRFTLTEHDGPGFPTLAYRLWFDGVDFTGLDGDPGNDASAIHFHDTTGVDHSAGTPHVLNLFGFPAFDDDDFALDASFAVATGVWDDGDLSDGALAGNPAANSDTLTSSLAALRAGELFVMLHTTSPNALPGTPGITIGGQILPVPEPSTGLLGLAALFVGIWSRPTSPPRGTENTRTGRGSNRSSS